MLLWCSPTYVRQAVVVQCAVRCCAVATKAGELHCPAHGASCDQIWCEKRKRKRAHSLASLPYGMYVGLVAACAACQHPTVPPPVGFLLEALSYRHI